MKIVLLQDIDGLGKKGDIKNVSDGYGRNFLIRKNLVEILTPEIENRIKLREEKQEKDAVKLKSQTAIIKENIEKLKLVIKTKIGKTGQVFGSITPVKIAAELEKQGIRLQKEQILSSPIKTLGEHKIKIKLPQEIGAELTILIESEDTKKDPK
ncbi:MAG: 50S ribosomal protein L9 [Candidatus Azambacteria bacterium]|nr:50S ribosomal protein L9 [Candidatus Azambacteria bacterium]